MPLRDFSVEFLDTLTETLVNLETPRPSARPCTSLDSCSPITPSILPPPPPIGHRGGQVRLDAVSAYTRKGAFWLGRRRLCGPGAISFYCLELTGNRPPFSTAVGIGVLAAVLTLAQRCRERRLDTPWSSHHASLVRRLKCAFPTRGGKLGLHPRF